MITHSLPTQILLRNLIYPPANGYVYCEYCTREYSYYPWSFNKKCPHCERD